MSQVNLDEDGFINIEWYFKASCDIIERAAQERGQDITKLTANDMTPLYRRVYEALFRPEKGRGRHGEKCNLKYCAENISRLITLYTALAGEYNVLPSMEALELLTGIEDTNICKYVTDARKRIAKTRKTWVQNGLSQFPIGMVTLANNDLDTGLCYNRQNITDRATVNKALSFNDLVQIGEKTGNVSRIEEGKTQDIVVEDS